MRRSKRIATLTAGGACLMMLSACGEDTVKLPDTLTMYPDVASCGQATGDIPACRQALSQAAIAHYRDARTFRERSDCEETYGPGNCDAIPDNRGGHFVPAMAGFVLGSAMGVASAVPVHYDRQGYARVAGGYTLGKSQEERQQASSGGGGGGGGGAWGSGGSSRGTTIATDSSNLRNSSILRGGFGNSFNFHGGG